jgi:hypothetical protein
MFSELLNVCYQVPSSVLLEASMGCTFDGTPLKASTLIEFMNEIDYQRHRVTEIINP